MLPECVAFKDDLRRRGCSVSYFTAVEIVTQKRLTNETVS